MLYRIGASIIFLFLNIICLGQSKIQDKNYRSSLDSVNSWIVKVNTLIRNVNTIGSARVLANRIISRSEALQYPVGTASALSMIGISYYYVGKIDSAVFYNDLALVICNENKLDSLKAIIANTQGSLYRNLGKYGQAFDLEYTALEIEERRSNRKGIWRVLLNLAALHDNVGDFNKSIEIGKRSIAFADTFSTRLMMSYVNLGIAYYHSKNILDAIKTTHKALSLSRKLKNVQNEVLCLTDLTQYYLAQSNLDSARHFGKEAYLKAVDYNYATSLPAIINYGNVFLKSNEFDSSLFYLNKAMQLAKQINSKGDYADIFNLTSKALFEKGKYKDAYRLLDSARVYATNLKNDEVVKSISQSISSYEVLKKQQKLQQIDFEKNTAEIKLANQREITTYLIISSVVLVIISGIIYYFAIKVKKANRIIKQNNQDLQIKNQIIELANSELTEKTMRNQLNPHFIFNCLNSIQFLIVQKNNDEAFEYLTKFSYLLRKVLESTDKKSISVAEEIEIIEIYLQLESLRFDEQIHLLINTIGFDPTEIFIPPLITQPLIENAVHHGLAQKKGSKNLFVSFTVIENQLKCTIKDNGVGRTSKSQTTMGIKGESKGIKLTSTRLSAYNHILNDETIRTIDLFDSNNQPCGTQVELDLAI